MPQLFVPTQLTLVEVRVSPFFKRLFIGSFHFSSKNTLLYSAGRVTIQSNRGKFFTSDLALSQALPDCSLGIEAAVKTSLWRLKG